MAQFTRIETAQTMMETGIVPVFYHAEVEVAREVLAACYRGGIRAFEFTNRGDFAHEVFAELMKFAREELPEMRLGVGSVIDAGTTALYLQMGADFVVSPMLVEEMAVVCNRRKVLWAPGCGTLSEIGRAHELGAEIVKIFPATAVGGPGFVKAVLGPCPWAQIMPTGGVAPTQENLRGWFEAGAACVGMGSKLFPKEILAGGYWDRIEQMAAQSIAIVQHVRK